MRCIRPSSVPNTEPGAWKWKTYPPRNGRSYHRRWQLVERQQGKCGLCGEWLWDNVGQGFDVDHILPLRAGGAKRSIENQRIVHIDCHIALNRKEQAIQRLCRELAYISRRKLDNTLDLW